MPADAPRNKALAVILASMAAGPTALATLAIGALLSAQPIVLGAGPEDVLPAAAALAWLTMIATIFAAIPNVVGVTVMAWLGSRNVGARHPAMWALAGAAACGIPAWLALGPYQGEGWVAGWAAIGAGCALVARLTVRWND